MSITLLGSENEQDETPAMCRLCSNGEGREKTQFFLNKEIISQFLSVAPAEETKQGAVTKRRMGERGDA